jgi:hypothetical protein
MGNRKMISRIMFLVMTVLFSASVFSEVERRLFDHFDTTFPLTGMHMDVNCSACHINGVFKGTPQQCANCHNGILAIGKPANHVRSDDDCDNCHTTFDMADARFQHDNVTAPCLNCHNGSTAEGKTVDHTVTTQPCDVCHSTTSWSNVRFNHSMITAACSSCHNGISATGKNATHIVTTSECDVCHTTNTWMNVRFDHSTITAVCSSCHNGISATGKSATHIVTTSECDVCHSTSRWSAVTFVHSSIGNHNSSVSCTDCHVGGNYSPVFWPFPAYVPDCAACHADDYEIGEHKKTEVPSTVFYTVDELRDCAGSCHLYKDNSFTTVKEFRSGEHRVNASGF